MNTVEVKICGLTTYDDAAYALECGADYLGFVLYDKSPRGIDAAGLQAIVGKLPAGTRAVGVFVNASPEEVDRVSADSGLYAAQIHGNEDARGFAACATRLWRAVKLTAGGCTPDPEAWSVERYVVDTASAGVYGGSGVACDWNLARGFAAAHATMLAGGLKPSNVAAAVRQVAPMGVDVASGVESGPRRKDPAMVRTFIKNAKSVCLEQ